MVSGEREVAAMEYAANSHTRGYNGKTDAAYWG